MALTFDPRFEPAYGEAVTVAPDVSRITVRNPSPFTFHGTNSYVVGRDTLAVIDPGPENEEHLQTLLATIAGRPVSHIFVSHTHRDHSPLAARLKAETGALVLAEGPHRPARPCTSARSIPLDASADTNFRARRDAAGRFADRRRRLVDPHGPHPRPHRQPRGVRAGGNRHPVFRRSRHGVVDHHRRAAGRCDGRLHGVARHG